MKDSKKQREIREFLENQNKEIKKLSKDMALSYWKATISGKKEDYEDSEKKTLDIQKYFSNRENFEKVKNLLALSKEPLEKRQLEILYREYLSCQGDFKLIEDITKKSSNIEHKFNTFRAKLDGKEVTDNEIREILEKETNSEKLKNAWEACKKQGELVEKELIDLIKLRNKLAKSLGFKNYYNMALELSEQKEEEIESIFLELEKSTEKSFKRVKNEVDEKLAQRYGIKKDEIRPWHYQNLFFQEAPEIYEVNLDEFYDKDILKIAEDYYKDISFEIKDILDRSDLYEKPGKYQHAYCISIGNEGDIRVIENIKNNEKWMDTTLHELGHAVYEKHCEESLSFLLRENAHIFVTESIALLFGRKSKDISFIKKYGNFGNKNKIENIKGPVRKQLILDELVFLKWSQVMFHFEKELYNNPDQDLNKLWWNLVKKYQMLDFYRDKPDWASKIHLASVPVYYHNYLLGKILASQIDNYLKENVKADSGNPDNGNGDEKEVGQFLKTKIFVHGKKWRWNKLIEDSLGEPLTPKYFIEDFCG